MNSLSLILASMLCAGSPAIVETPESKKTTAVQQASNHFKLGKEVVQAVRSDYSAGSYSEFLKDMDSDYKKAKKANELEGLIEMRKETAKVKIHPQFADSYRTIQEAKNKKLLQVAASDSQTPFADKLASATQSISDIDGQLLSLNFKAPGEGISSDENALIEINLEYYYKAIHLDSLAAKKSMADRKEKHMALEIEKMDRMVQAANSFTDTSLKESVMDAAAILDERMAKSYDISDLLALSKGKVKPISTQEEKAAAIVSNSQGELAELHRHLLNSLDNDTQK